jgi:His/Glu/Gln/Arg/opine family amino acid ABC transporter permease subunit
VSGWVGALVAAGRGIDFGPVWDQRDNLVRGLFVDLQVAVGGLVLSIPGGLLLASLRRSGSWPLRVAGFTLVQLLRGAALYVMAVWFFYGLPAAGGPKFDPVPTGILVITLLYSGYLSEVFRAGLAAVPRGQTEAAQAVGLGRTTTFVSVTLPQTVRIVLPAMGNVFADIVKDTAILSVIGLNDLMRESLRWAQFYRPFRYFEFITVAGLVYLVLVVAVTQAGRLLERRTGDAGSASLYRRRGFLRIRGAGA